MPRIHCQKFIKALFSAVRVLEFRCTSQVYSRAYLIFSFFLVELAWRNLLIAGENVTHLASHDHKTFRTVPQQTLNAIKRLDAASARRGRDPNPVKGCIF